MAEEKKKRFTKRNLPASVRLAVESALAKKAEDLCVLDLRELSSFTDFFLVMNGSSSGRTPPSPKRSRRRSSRPASAR